MNAEGKAKADKLRDELRRYGKKFKKLTTLNSMGADGRAEKKRMQEIRMHQKAASAGLLWNPNGKNQARGSSAKAKRIQSGLRAKAMQGAGL